MVRHKVNLTHQEKIDWFLSRIEERSKTKPFEDEEQLIVFLRELRLVFKTAFLRDVPGYFIRKIAEKCGVTKSMISESTKEKMTYAFNLMDTNTNYRENKSDLIRALTKKFDEKTLHYIVDDIWEEWHSQVEHPEPEVNTDFFGQQTLF